MEVAEALRKRKSCRGFLSRDIPDEVILQLLEDAAHSPSSTNMQPWEVVVVKGKSLKRFVDQMLLKFDQHQASNPEVSAYPEIWKEPFKSRRKECGIGLYKALGIAREDKEKKQAQQRANLRAFDAPVVMILTMNKELNTGSLMDCGMFLQSLMLAATAQGLASCPTASLVSYPEVIRQVLEVGQDQWILTGLALGYEDTSHPANRFQPERLKPLDFSRIRH